MHATDDAFRTARRSSTTWRGPSLATSSRRRTRGQPPTRRATRVYGRRSPTRRRGPRKPSRSACPMMSRGRWATSPSTRRACRWTSSARAARSAIWRSAWARSRASRSCPARSCGLSRAAWRAARGSWTSRARLRGSRSPATSFGDSMDRCCATQCRLGIISAPPSPTNG